MGGQQCTGHRHDEQLACIESLEQGAALQLGDQAKGEDGEGSAAIGDDGRIRMDEGAEDAGQAEQHSGDMGHHEGVAGTRPLDDRIYI